jgi:hypothetical protein
LVRSRRLFRHDNLLAPALLEAIVLVMSGKQTARSTALIVQRNRVTERILASEIEIAAAIRNMFTPTLSSSNPITVLTRLCLQITIALIANVITIAVNARNRYEWS